MFAFPTFGGLLPLSLKSHSRASLTKLFVRISNFWKIKMKCDEVEYTG
jgi:hypothetical protein